MKPTLRVSRRRALTVLPQMVGDGVGRTRACGVDSPAAAVDERRRRDGCGARPPAGARCAEPRPGRAEIQFVEQRRRGARPDLDAPARHSQVTCRTNVTDRRGGAIGAARMSRRARARARPQRQAARDHRRRARFPSAEDDGCDCLPQDITVSPRALSPCSRRSRTLRRLSLGCPSTARQQVPVRLASERPLTRGVHRAAAATRRARGSLPYYMILASSDTAVHAMRSHRTRCPRSVVASFSRRSSCTPAITV